MNLKQDKLSVGGVLDSRQLRKQRKIELKAAYVNRLKASIAVSFAMIIALTVTVFQLNKRHDQQLQENSRLQSHISTLNDQISEDANKMDMITASNDSTSSKALSYINGIQTKLAKINNYLTKRGLHSVAFKAGKPTTQKPEKNAYVKLYDRYNKYLEQLTDKIAIMPMGYPRISSFTSFFGNRSNPFNYGRKEFHPGLDFKGNTGDPVKCTASGKVVFTGRAGGYGNCVKIRHTNGIETWYGHLSRISVREGQSVSVAQVIGKVGSTGRSTGPHLHYEVRRNGKAVNPVQYLSLN